MKNPQMTPVVAKTLYASSTKRKKTELMQVFEHGLRSFCHGAMSKSVIYHVIIYVYIYIYLLVYYTSCNIMFNATFGSSAFFVPGKAKKATFAHLL